MSRKRVSVRGRPACYGDPEPESDTCAEECILLKACHIEMMRRTPEVAWHNFACGKRMDMRNCECRFGKLDTVYSHAGKGWRVRVKKQ